MKAICVPFLALLFLSLVSCGKNGGGSSGSSSPQEETRRNGYVDTSSQGETELLNVTTSEAVSIEGDRVTFSRPVSIQDSGLRKSCSLSISAGEIWHFQKRGDSMELDFLNGKRLRLKASGSSWVWNGNENGMKIRRRFTFLPNRIVINQDCEG